MSASPQAVALLRDSHAISRLRELHPGRPLSRVEADHVAEHQAALLLELLGVREGPVPDYVVAELPGILVEERHDWPTSGMSVQAGSEWRIVLKASEPKQRRRFTLAHEFKHVLDDPFYVQPPKYLPTGTKTDRVERLCNHFAACLLMPRTWIKRDFASGLQDPVELARRYFVSTEAMTTRLIEIGLRPRAGAERAGPFREGAAS